MERQALFWIAYDPFEDDYFDAIQASTPGVYRTLEAWGQEGATIELVSETEADSLLNDRYPQSFDWRNPIRLITHILQFFLKMLIDVVIHPILTIKRLFIVIFIGLLFSYGWRWLFENYLASGL